MALRSFASGALFAEVLGGGPLRILALHGWGRRGADFKSSLEGLPALAPDLPGFGATPPPQNVIGAEGYADIVADLLPEFDEPPVLVGHSFGGRVGLCLAAKHPELVGPLILTGVPLVRLKPAAKPAPGYRAIKWLNKVGVFSDAKLEAERRKRGSDDYRAATGLMREVFVKVVNESYEDQLGTVENEMLLLWGSEDREVPVEVAERARDLRISAGLQVELNLVPGVGHLLPVTSPGKLRQAVEVFL